jgi:hypothetical protein
MKMAAAEIRERWPDVVETFADLDAFLRDDGAQYYGDAGKHEGILQVDRRCAEAPSRARRTMELGAGPGLLTSHLSGCEYYLITEMWEPFLAELREIAAGRAEIEVQSLDVTDLPAKARAFAIV